MVDTYEYVPSSRELESEYGPDDEENKDTQFLFDHPRTTPRIRWCFVTMCILVAVVALQSGALFIVLTTHHLAGWDVSTDTECENIAPDKVSLSALNADLRRTSIYSPVFDAVDLNVTSRMFNGAFRDNTSIWRQPPSPAVDEAWDYVTAEGHELITVSANDIRRAGKDPAIVIKAPASWGGSAHGAYFSQVEVFHQIHCLNELRKEMFRDYYYGDTAATASPTNELRLSHKTHCIHLLLQALMCSADVGIVTHNWVRNEKLSDPKTRPFPDFGVNKMCRDFDSLLDWVRINGVQDVHAKVSRLRHPPGAPIVPGDGYI